MSMAYDHDAARLGAQVMLDTRVSQGKKSATAEDVQAALARLDAARNWIVATWPQFADGGS